MLLDNGYISVFLTKDCHSVWFLQHFKKKLLQNTHWFTAVFLGISKTVSQLTWHFSNKLLFLFIIYDQKMCSWVQSAAQLAGRLPAKIDRKQTIAVVLSFEVMEFIGTAGRHCNIIHTPIIAKWAWPRMLIRNAVEQYDTIRDVILTCSQS